MSEHRDTMTEMRARVERAIAEMRDAIDHPKVGDPWWILGRVGAIGNDLVRDGQCICAAGIPHAQDAKDAKGADAA